MRLISREVHTMDEKKQNDQIQLFENQKIRTAWDAEQEEWYFSVVLPNAPNGGQILDIEDFLVSNLLLPLGSLVYLLFCVTKWGWGFDKYLEEANTGTGLKMSRAFKPYFQFVLPIIILVILIQGLI